MNYYKNPYYSCYPYKRFGYLQLVRKDKNWFVPAEMIRYYEIINKAFHYAYGMTLFEAGKKLLTYIKIGETKCADELANKINDVFYLYEYIHHNIYSNLLYNTTTCKDKEFLKCLIKYWYCKRIDIRPIIKEFELEACEEDGIDYMIIIDPLVNPTATPPNEVK
jgi:hypothetical protein